ncbi:MAG: type II secretion system F family protein [Nostocoides sp.]
MSTGDLARLGIVLGLLGGLGLSLIWLGLPRHRRAGLSGRIDPYLADRPRPSRLLAREPGSRSGVFVLVAPTMIRWGVVVERVLGGAESVRRRLVRAGRTPDVDSFRAEQVMWGIAGALLGGLTAVVLGKGGSPVSVTLFAGIGLGVGVVGRDMRLSHQAGRREQRILAEFPTVAELLALAVAAGEGTVGALARVCRLSRGVLSEELGVCLADARVGSSLPDALAGLADRTGLPSLARFVDGIVVAVERGTPLAEVLRAQAQDVRDDGRRQLMEEGGRKEISMMIPVVFLILPITVLFAVYPGFSFLSFDL